jgi:hypothetical protein
MLLELNPIHQHSAADAKIRFFRSLFRGRDDVYPRRFESRKTGKSGYALPAVTSGFGVSVRSRKSNAGTASINDFFR